MLGWLDHKIGKHLFVPPIIKLCQKTKITQYGVFSYCWS